MNGPKWATWAEIECGSVEMRPFWKISEHTYGKWENEGAWAWMGMNGRHGQRWICVSFTTNHAISCYSLYEGDCMKRPVFLSKCCEGECSAGMYILRVDLGDEELR